MSGEVGAAFLELFDALAAAFLGLKGTEPELRPDGIVICSRMVGEVEGQVPFSLTGRLIKIRSVKSVGV